MKKIEKKTVDGITTSFDNSDVYYKYKIKDKLIRKSVIVDRGKKKKKNDIPLRKLGRMSVTDWPPWTGNRISNVLRRSRG